MFKSVLVPLDGSELAECVLPHVVAIASAYQARVRLFHALTSDRPDDRPADLFEWQVRKAEVKAYLADVQARLGEVGASVQTVVAEGAPAEQIVHAVRRTGSDLLILSTHGKSGLAPWNVSGVVDKVIQYSPTSLLVVRAQQEVVAERPLNGGYRRLMLPLDGSTRAETVLPAAEALARHWDAELLLTHVIAQPRLFRSSLLGHGDQALLDDVVYRHREQAAHYFQELQARLPVRTDLRLVVAENVVAALQEVIEQEQVDLVLFSAHGHGCTPFQRYGSLVSSCILYGTVPLLIMQDLPPDQIQAPAWVERQTTVVEAGRLPSGTGFQAG